MTIESKEKILKCKINAYSRVVLKVLSLKPCNRCNYCEAIQQPASAKHSTTLMDAADITDKVTSLLTSWPREMTVAAGVPSMLVIAANDRRCTALVVFIFPDHRIRNAGRLVQRCHGDDKRCCVDLAQRSLAVRTYVRTDIRTNVRTYAADVS